MHTITVAIASSYLTLGIFAAQHARDLWAPYAVVVFCLAVANLTLERRQ